MRCRGAISDFYAYKAKIQDADYTPLVVRTNEDDLFGDGNNYQVRDLSSGVSLIALVIRSEPNCPGHQSAAGLMRTSHLSAHHILHQIRCCPIPPAVGLQQGGCGCVELHHRGGGAAQAAAA